MDRSRHTETKYLNDEKTHKAINGIFFKKLNNVSKELYEVELVKSKIERREPIIVGFFILKYGKLRMLGLYFISFDKYCDVNIFKELEMDTDSIYLALIHDNLYECFRPSKKSRVGSSEGTRFDDSFKADAVRNFFPRICCDKDKKHDKREPGLFKEE